MAFFSDNIPFSMNVGRGQYELYRMSENNKKTYETKLITVLNEMKEVGSDLDKKKLELENIKIKQKELKELYAMQYEEKIQIMIEKRLLHLSKMSQIDSSINEEEHKKKDLIKEQKNIVDKMREMIHISNILLEN